MNNKMTAKSQLSTTEPQKQKLSKQNRNRTREMEIKWRVFSGEEERKVQGLRSVIGRHKIDG